MIIFYNFLFGRLLDVILRCSVHIRCSHKVIFICET